MAAIGTVEVKLRVDTSQAVAAINVATIATLELHVAELTRERDGLRMQVERLQGALGRAAVDLETIADDVVADLRVRAAAMRSAGDREQCELEL